MRELDIDEEEPVRWTDWLIFGLAWAVLAALGYAVHWLFGA